MRRGAMERRRLLGLRRVVSYQTAGAHPPVPAVAPDAISRAIASDDGKREHARLIGDICDALYPETKAWR